MRFLFADERNADRPFGDAFVAAFVRKALQPDVRGRLAPGAGKE